MARTLSDMELMAIADGEAASVHLDESGRNIVEGIQSLGEGLRTYTELETDDVPGQLDLLWAKVEADISSSKSQVRRPVRIDEKTPWWRNSWSGLFAGGALAAATLLLVFMTRPFERIVETQVATPNTHVVAPVSLKHSPPEVEHLEVHNGSGFILTIPGGEDESDTVVIWVTPEESKQEDPI